MKEVVVSCWLGRGTGSHGSERVIVLRVTVLRAFHTIPPGRLRMLRSGN